jgi:hypothetical protein
MSVDDDATSLVAMGADSSETADGELFPVPRGAADCSRGFASVGWGTPAHEESRVVTPTTMRCSAHRVARCARPKTSGEYDQGSVIRRAGTTLGSPP